RRQSVHRLFYGCDRERRTRVQLDRRPRRDANRNQANHRRMKAVALALVAAAAAATAAEIAPEERRSGYDFAAPETRAMQDDDAANPGFLGVLQVVVLWIVITVAADWSFVGCDG